MARQAYNPFLPEWEYIPDGEPRVFGERLYLYGSHDRFGGPLFCMEDYVCYSAPLDDLTYWHNEGVIYRKGQDPLNETGLRCIYAPDVVQGPDGRFYLFYALDFAGVMSVAVCDTPAGEYSFHGHLRFKDGHIWGRRSGEPFPFDPGVLVDDDGRVYLYSGFATRVPTAATALCRLTNPGCVVLELEPDMCTIKRGPKLVLRTERHTSARSSFAGHEFFEAASPRKIDGLYHLVYSSRHNHELCYATAKHPAGPFSFGGTLVSIGDLFLHGNTDESRAANYLGNTHGGIVCVKGQWYIFYHRQTNRHSYSRQACAEPLQRDAGGRFLQAEVTSCGLNGGPLPGRGKYPARIACNLWAKDGTARYDTPAAALRLVKHPCFTQNKADPPQQYIANMRDSAVAGFKYFIVHGLRHIAVQAAGCGKGVIQVATNAAFGFILAEIPLNINGTEPVWHIAGCKMAVAGRQALYFRFKGEGYVDFYGFSLSDGQFDTDE